MAFRSNREIEGTAKGDRIRLTAPLRVAKGEFTTGSILRVTGDPDARGEFRCIDEESGESVGVHPALSSYEQYHS